MEMGNSGLISIVVPVYKVEAELDRCVQSLLHQTYSNIEIILVDDGSPDNCPKLCDAYAKKNLNVRVIHKENGGLSDARNFGLDEAKGEYVLYVDSDDYIELDACEKLISVFKKEVEIVVGVCREICGNGIKYQRHTNIIPGRVYDARDFVINSIKNFEWYAPAWLNMYRRDFLIENKLYYKKGYLYEDIQMLPRIFQAANKVIYMDYPFYNYIIRENSIMTSENTLHKVKITIDIYTEWYEWIKNMDDQEYQRYMYGYLVKLYLKSARTRKINGWKIPGMGMAFGIKYAIGIREKIKVLFFSLIPSVYIR